MGRKQVFCSNRFKEVSFCFQFRSSGIQCQICHMVFNDQSAISAHYDTAHAQSSDNPNAKYECTVCGKKMTSKQSLERHKTNTHGLGEKTSLSCDVCGYVTYYKSALTRHMKTVHK